MIQKSHDGIWRSTLLMQIPHLIQGFSPKNFGDMENPANVNRMLQNLGLSKKHLIVAEQIHKNRVYLVKNSDTVATVMGADALVYFGRSSAAPLLGVHAADCVPLLLIDSKNLVMATVHAGWKGTLAGITQKTVQIMKNQGADLAEIKVLVGPHIHSCCYTVDETRVKLFKSALLDKDIARKINGCYHLDLGLLNVRQLIAAGVKRPNIDHSAPCTACHHREFFSFRKDHGAKFGKILGFIGIN